MDKEINICSCGKPLIDCINKLGKKIGVTHSIEDEDWHLKYWSKTKIIERVKAT